MSTRITLNYKIQVTQTDATSDPEYSNSITTAVKGDNIQSILGGYPMPETYIDPDSQPDESLDKDTIDACLDGIRNDLYKKLDIEE